MKDNKESRPSKPNTAEEHINSHSQMQAFVHAAIVNVFLLLFLARFLFCLL